MAGRGNMSTRSSNAAIHNEENKEANDQVLTRADRDLILEAINNSKQDLSNKIDGVVRRLDATDTRVTAVEEKSNGNSQRITVLEEEIQEFRTAKVELQKATINTENKTVMNDLKMKERNIVVF